MEDFYVDPPTGGGKEFALASEGMHNAVLVKVHANAYTKDYPNAKTGKVDSVPHCRFTWEIEDTDEDGQQITVIRNVSQKWGTTEVRSNLRDLVEDIIGTRIPQEQIKSFNIGGLVGAQNKIVIKHNMRGDKTFANVVTILKRDPGVDLKPSKRFSGDEEVPF